MPGVAIFTPMPPRLFSEAPRYSHRNTPRAVAAIATPFAFRYMLSSRCRRRFAAMYAAAATPRLLLLRLCLRLRARRLHTPYGASSEATHARYAAYFRFALIYAATRYAFYAPCRCRCHAYVSRVARHAQQRRRLHARALPIRLRCARAYADYCRMRVDTICCALLRYYAVFLRALT